MDFDKKSLIKYFIIFGILVLILIGSVFFRRDNKNKSKLYKQYDFVYEITTDYYRDNIISNLPQINIVNDSISNLNKEIMNVYYNLVALDGSSYRYSYFIYDNILSLLIITNSFDDSEFGNIKYYSYNIDMNSFKVLSNNDLLDEIGISYDLVSDMIDNKVQNFYNIDSLKNEMTFNNYKTYILSDYDYRFAIIDNTLYMYHLINYTHDIVHDGDAGNIYEFKIANLK